MICKGVVTYKGDKMEGTMTMSAEGEGANFASGNPDIGTGDCKQGPADLHYRQ